MHYGTDFSLKDICDNTTEFGQRRFLHKLLLFWKWMKASLRFWKSAKRKWCSCWLTSTAGYNDPICGRKSHRKTWEHLVWLNPQWGVNVQVPVSPEARMNFWRLSALKRSLTLSSKNSGLMKSSRNMVSGAFSQSAIDLEESRETGVNVREQMPASI